MITSERYVLNVVQNPKLLDIAYRSIDDGNETEDELEADTGLTSEDDGSGTLDQAVEGLLTFGLISRSEYEYETQKLEFETGDWGVDFRLTMLHNVASEATSSDWGKQSAVVLNYEYLLDSTQYFHGTSSELRKKIDRWHQDIGYEPRNKRGERQKLNPEKWGHWRNQAEYLGLIHPTKGQSSTYTVAPDPRIVEASIRAACERAGDGDRIETARYVDWLEDNLLRVPLTDQREFPESMSRTLYELANDGVVEFVKHGDRGQVDLKGVPTQKNDGIAKNANVVKVVS